MLPGMNAVPAAITAGLEFLDVDWVKERIGMLGTFLSDGLFDAEHLGGLRDLSNASLATGSATHALWIPNKNVAMPMSVSDAKNYITEMSLRIARKLALVPFLYYDHPRITFPF